MTKILATALLFMIATTATVQAKHHAITDEEMVIQAGYDYIDGFYKADIALFERAVWPKFNKVGFWRENGSSPYQGPMFMSWDDAHNLIGRWKERNPTPSQAPRRVSVLEVSEQIATVKVEAFWGFDYLQLAKIEGAWMIVNILWQSPPA